MAEHNSQANVFQGESSSSGSCDTIIEGDIDNAIAKIQVTAAKAVGISANLENAEIEAALSNIETSREIGDHASLTRCQLAAFGARKITEETKEAVAGGRNLLEKITATTDFFRSDDRVGSTINDLENKARYVEIALDRVETCVNECLSYARLVEVITDETLSDNRNTLYLTCSWRNKCKASIIVALQTEQAALSSMRHIWLNARDYMGTEESANDDNTTLCNRLYRWMSLIVIIHIICSFVGVSSLYILSLIKIAKDSFYAILSVGMLITGWCAVYWLYKLNKCLKLCKERKTAAARKKQRMEFLGYCDDSLHQLERRLINFDVAFDSQVESDTRLLENVDVAFDSQVESDTRLLENVDVAFDSQAESDTDY